MKRVIALVLAIIATFSLCACGGNNKNAKNPTTKETEKGIFHLQAKPTAEEEKALSLYNQIVRAIYKAHDDYMYLVVYDENGNTTEYYDQEALAFCAEQLQQLECVDKWVGTEYCLDGWDSPSINWNRQELLDRFVVVEDVFLRSHYHSVDKLGNENEGFSEYPKYNENGQLISGSLNVIGWNIYKGWDEYIYDENGRIVKANDYDDKGKIISTVISSYDETGRKISDKSVIDFGAIKDCEYLYIYDNNDCLIYVDCVYIGEDYVYRYWDGEYDENGHLIKTTRYYDYGGIIGYEEYTYSNDYKIVNIAKYGGIDDGDKYIITLDELGRFVKEERDYSDGASTVCEYIYGNYYILKSAK